MKPELDRPTSVGGTPIFTLQWPDTKQLNEQLREVVLRKKETTPGLKKSNCGGWHSQTDFQLWPDAPVRTLMDMLLQGMLPQVIKATAPGAPEGLFKGWEVESWANVNKMEDSASQHDHVGGTNLWSAIYYVDTGEDGEVRSGLTKFVDMSGVPRPLKGDAATADRTAPIKTWQDACGLSPVGEEYDIQVEPVPGKMVMFPSTLPHYVTPYLSERQRITIAFNLKHPGYAVADPQNPRARKAMMWRNFRGVMLAGQKAKGAARDGLAQVVPPDRWPAPVRKRLLGGN
ncbi:hypothetical protein BKA01_002991 [Pseudonocardia eucalypti]|uniref:putative 2OG-Fe(II) oxygenase n=1 Tax=Pseudonocardia eucalypti TaxID=648755 RepID=UPI0016145E48|nr:hypothetical protein [Pseudonocardia eucalypti]